MYISDLGIILTKYTKTEFWIHSKDTFDLLFSCEQPVQKIKSSNNDLLVQDHQGMFWLMSFKHERKEKEILELVYKKPILETEKYTRCIFKWPFVGFQNMYNFNITLLNIQDPLKIVKIDIDQLTAKTKIHSLTKNYLLSLKDQEIWIYKLSYLKEPFIKIQVENGYDQYIEEPMFFQSSNQLNQSDIICCHLETGKKTKTTIYCHRLMSIEKQFVFAYNARRYLEIHAWNSDYTKLTWLKTISDIYMYKTMNCFHSSLPFLAFKIVFDQWYCKVYVYSKNHQELCIIQYPKEHFFFKHDSVSKIYSLLKLEHSTYLHTIDFNCL